MSIMIAGLALAIVMQSLTVKAWGGAPSNPPDNNVDAPINVGGGGALGTPARYIQTKNGALTLTGLLTVKDMIFNPDASVIPAGKVLVSTGNDGTIAWGASNDSSVHGIVTLEESAISKLTLDYSAMNLTQKPTILLTGEVSGSSDRPLSLTILPNSGDSTGNRKVDIDIRRYHYDSNTCSVLSGNIIICAISSYVSGTQTGVTKVHYSIIPNETGTPHFINGHNASYTASNNNVSVTIQ